MGKASWPLEAVHHKDLQAACRLVRECGWETGHADTCEQLVAAVLAQVDKRITQLKNEITRQGDKS